jgi:hypothetical protein
MFTYIKVVFANIKVMLQYHNFLDAVFWHLGIT